MTFRFEQLDVWPLTLEYVDACFILADKLPRRWQFSLGEQWRRAATSIAANLAEGAGKSTRPSERNFYDIARGSLAETVAILALAQRRGLISEDHYRRMYRRANRISAMLWGLLRSLDDRVSETQASYETEADTLAPIFALEEPADPTAPPRHLVPAPPPNDPPPWRTLSSREVFRNRWLTVVIDQVQLPTGESYEYTRLEPAGVGVGILGFDAQGQVLLEREYRHGVGQVIWQLPGGLAAPDEDLLAAGLRELQEETGYAPYTVNEENVRYLGAVWDNPAFGPMISHIYAVQGLEPVGDTRHDRGEFLTCHWVEWPWLVDAVAQGEIRDRVVIAAVAWMITQKRRSA